MFRRACGKIRESIFGIMGTSLIPQNGPTKTINITTGTAFMVAPGYLVTAAHLMHQNNDPAKPKHQLFEVLRSPESGSHIGKATLIAEDSAQDIALLEIEKTAAGLPVKLSKRAVPRGTNCGFLGFPFARVEIKQNEKRFHMVERFQGGYISAQVHPTHATGRKLHFYEVDTLMYAGSSGCPGFTVQGEVIGMQIASRTQKSDDEGRTERVAIALAVPAEEIQRFLSAHHIRL